MVRLILEEAILGAGGDQDKEPVMPDVMHVCQAGTIPPRPCSLKLPSVVLLKQLLVHPLRILPLQDNAGHVESISMPHLTDGKLFNKALDRCGFIPIRHGSRYYKPMRYLIANATVI
nr:hypothetical protein [Nitrosomonas nitrosa]